jgi:hypothetical protein
MINVSVEGSQGYFNVVANGVEYAVSKDRDYKGRVWIRKRDWTAPSFGNFLGRYGKSYEKVGTELKSTKKMGCSVDLHGRYVQFSFRAATVKAGVSGAVARIIAAEQAILSGKTVTEFSDLKIFASREAAQEAELAQYRAQAAAQQGVAS